ncbi:MAG: hypothetical protein HDS03_05840 [Bacteroides sp.]|nr:hypothetical protein [Bacteroides sp.]
MKRAGKIFALLVALTSSLISNAENHWNVYAGGSLSHLCNSHLTSSLQCQLLV